MQGMMGRKSNDTGHRKAGETKKVDNIWQVKLMRTRTRQERKEKHGEYEANHNMRTKKNIVYKIQNQNLRKPSARNNNIPWQWHLPLDNKYVPHLFGTCLQYKVLQIRYNSKSYHHVLPPFLNANKNPEHAGWYVFLLLCASASLIKSPLYSTTKSPWLNGLLANTPRPAWKNKDIFNYNRKIKKIWW